MKAAIFDLDGTVLDSMPVWKECDLVVLERRGVEVPEDVHARVKTMSLQESSEYFISRFALEDDPDTIQQEVVEAVTEQYRHSIPPKESIGDFLKHLKKSGVKMCVATATEEELARVALERLGLLPYFEFILTCDEVGFGKEHAVVYDESLRRLGVEKHEAVIFEDALHGIETAKRAGYHVVGVHDLSADEDGTTEAVRRRCDRYIHSYAELL